MALNSSINRTIVIGVKFDSATFVRQVRMASDSLRGLARANPMGDLSRVNMAAPTAGAANLAKGVGSVGTAARTAIPSIRAMGLQIAAALGVVGVIYKATSAVVGFFTSGIKGAVNLGETLAKTGEVFGAQTDSVVSNADKMAKAFGLPKGELLDAAASIGLIAKGSGSSTQAAAALSNQLVNLAADASSFYNVPMDSALEKIRSGLIGEAEPLRAFGVLLSETAVQAEAMRMGLAKGSGKLDESAKVAARASLITKGLATATGDLARTQDSAANQFRKSEGGLANFATTVGTMLMPMVTAAIGGFNELLATLITVFEDNRPMLQGWADAITNTFFTVSDTLASAGDYVTIFQLIVAEKIANVIVHIETMASNLGLVADYIATNWRDIITTTIDGIRIEFQNLATNLGELANSFYQFLKNPAGGFVFDWKPLLEGFEPALAALPEMIKPPLVSLQADIDAAGERIANRTAARVKARATAKLPGPAKPEAAKEKPLPKPSDYKGVAAAEIGSSEAGSSIARFLNQGGGTEAKETAAATKETAKHTKNMAQAIKEIAARGKTEAHGLATFTI
jgi:hypothetical protein